LKKWVGGKMTNFTFQHESTVGVGAGVLAVGAVETVQAANGDTIVYGAVRGEAEEGLVEIMVWRFAANGTVTLLERVQTEALPIAGCRYCLLHKRGRRVISFW
jgi:hypothetical protein